MRQSAGKYLQSIPFEYIRNYYKITDIPSTTIPFKGVSS
jgi:hypothetical protein